MYFKRDSIGCLFVFMKTMTESHPKIKKNSCSYCGDAPINHTRSFLESAVFVTVDSHMKTVIKFVPFFIKHSIDVILEFFFKILLFLKIAKLSRDIEKAGTLRSKVIWEEAKRRGIVMEQVIFLGKPLDHYRAKIRIGKKIKDIYFESIPIRPEFLDMEKSWDDKAVLKREFEKNNIPVPAYVELAFLNFQNLEKVFAKLRKPIIVKPRVGSRGRHTATNIQNFEQFKEGVKIANQICSYLIAEEHLEGSVCRATLVNGVLAGFYQAQAPAITGDGKKTIKELIEEKDTKRNSRVERINISEELHSHIARSGFSISDILPNGVPLSLTHRMGRLFGGTTREMFDELHPSFVPILEKAAKITGLSVVGFDCIVPDPTKDQASQRWGIIECNSLPFIDLHYYALEGKPKNIAGMIWDMWK